MPRHSQSIPLPAWSHLHELAGEIHALAPWERMEEDQLFAIRDPATGALAACSVMGALGSHRALAFYLGGEGIRAFLHAHEEDRTDRQRANTMLLCPHLQLCFEDRAALRPQDLAVIKKLGRRYRGSMAWPQFRAHHSARMPWFLSPEEARMLAVFLEQAVAVLRQDEEPPSFMDSTTIPLRECSEEHGWRDLRIRPEDFPTREVFGVEIEAGAGIFDGLPHRKGEWEIDMSLVLAPIDDGEGTDAAPQFPLLLLAADARSGIVVGMEMLATRPSYGEALAQIPDAAAALFQKAGFVPSVVRARHPLLLQIFDHFRQDTAWAVQPAAALPALDEAFDALEARMTGLGGLF